MRSIEQAIGRLLLGRIPGPTLNSEHRKQLAAGRLSGITLFKENCRNLEQLARLTHDIVQSSMHVPVLTVDQEGGAVQRFEDAISPLPSPMALAALGNEELVRVTEIGARQLQKLGFNLLLAPTLDLQTNPLNPIICTRAFGSSPQQVSQAGLKALESIERAGLRACGKHFPGHGSTSEDSHLALAVVSKSRTELMTEDLAPFIDNLPHLSSILVGHIWLPQIDEDPVPATLSKKIVSGLLRQELGYDGLLVSDDMLMKGLTNRYGLSEACILAIEAGLDLLLVLGTIEETMDAHRALVEAVKSGRLSEARILASIKRLQRLFPERPRTLNPEDEEARQKLKQFAIEIEETTESLVDVSARAVVQYGKAEPLKAPGEENGNGKETADCPLKSTDTWHVLAPRHPRYPMNLVSELKNLEPTMQLVDWRYDLEGDLEEFSKRLASIEGEKQVIFLTYRALVNKQQGKMMQELLKSCRLVHVAVDSPYDLVLCENSRKTAAYALMDPSNLAIQGLARVLTGRARAEGKLNIDLSPVETPA